MFRIVRSMLLTLAVASPLVAAELSEEIAVVERLRGLKFVRPVAQKIIPRQQLRPFLIEQLKNDLPIAVEDYLRVLDALELIERKPDTLKTLLDLYDSQVLAFYDPATDVYYSLAEPPSGIELNEMITKAVAIHELTHALQDQRFNAGDRLLAMRGNTDAQLAYQAVLEGEALLIMSAALVELLDQSLDGLVQNDALINSMSALADLNPGVPADTPPYFVEGLKFPYFAGLRLVIAAYRRGGWSAVDALHRSPPRSTEQVLHPDSYFAEKVSSTPLSVAAADRKALLTETMGEFSWRFLLGEKAAAGWGNDSVQVFSGPSGQWSVWVESSWDTEADAKEFAAAYGEFLKSRSLAPKLTRRGRRVSVSYLTPDPLTPDSDP